MGPAGCAATRSGVLSLSRARARDFVKHVGARSTPRAPRKALDDPNATGIEASYLTYRATTMDPVHALVLRKSKCELGAHEPANQPATPHAATGVTRKNAIPALGEVQVRIRVYHPGCRGAAHIHLKAVQADHTS